MRPDMARILVDRGRYETCSPSYSERLSRHLRRARCRDDEEALPLRMRMREGIHVSHEEYLTPLERFLMRRRGQRWDDVYAELRAQLAPKNTIDMHIMQHLWGYVLFARREGERVVLVDKWGGYHYVLEQRPSARRGSMRHAFLYVCADSGRLELARGHELTPYHAPRSIRPRRALEAKRR
jgi:hypothetical protein